MAIAEEDGLIVDLVVGGLSLAESRETAQDRAVDAERLNAVSRFFKLIDQTPTMEPSKDLVQATMERINARGNS
jgi:hypothetical protein